MMRRGSMARKSVMGAQIGLNKGAASWNTCLWQAQCGCNSSKIPVLGAALQCSSLCVYQTRLLLIKLLCDLLAYSGECCQQDALMLRHSILQDAVGVMSTEHA